MTTIDTRRDAPHRVAVVVPEPRAIVSWSSIVAGALIAVTVLFLLSLVALAAGLEVAPVADAGDPMLGPAASAVVTGLFVVLAFGAGGLTAVWAAGIVDPGAAALHGFLVWALALLLMLLLVAFGLGGFGATTTFLGPAFEAADLQDFQDAAWASVLALALATGSAVLGGVLATREEVSRVW